MAFAAIHIPAGVHSFMAANAPYAAFASMVVALLAVFFAIHMSRRLDKLTVGGTNSFEETIRTLTEHMQDATKFRTELEHYLKLNESRLRTSLRGVGVVRFNPFANDGSSGGNQSFSIALLDETVSGVVFSALYSRDRVGVYAKPIVGGVSTFTLSDEEQDAVNKATTSLTERK